jgi:hypothetical protein
MASNASFSRGQTLNLDNLALGFTTSLFGRDSYDKTSFLLDDLLRAGVSTLAWIIVFNFHRGELHKRLCLIFNNYFLGLSFPLISFVDLDK